MSAITWSFARRGATVRRYPQRLLSLAAVMLAPSVQAQSLVPTLGWSLGTSASGWVLPTPFAQTTGRIGATGQGAVPLALRANVGRWRVDASGAYVYGMMSLLPLEDSDAEGRALHVTGPTDVRVRATGPLFSDAWRLTLGANLPTGKTQLSSDETVTLQTMAAPGFALPITALGTGGGATVGLLRAFGGSSSGGAGWAFAVGTSLEKRAAYSPVALAFADGTLTNTITPGNALHVTVGADRVFDAGRLSAVLIGDLYSTDVITQRGAGALPTPQRYTLGPQMTATVGLDLATAGWRERAVSIGVRRRAAFADSTGAAVAGSAGTYVDGTVSLVRGGALGTGLVVGLDGHWQSGLPFTVAIVGAAASTAGITVGVDHAGIGVRTRTYLRAAVGSFDTGKQRGTGYGVTFGVIVGSRGVQP